MSRAVFGAIIASALLAIGCLRGPAESPLELKLGLARSKIKVGESLWYWVELKNVGRSPQRIYDDFIFHFQAVGSNSGSRKNLHLVILDPDGEEVRFHPGYAGNHGEFSEYDNDYSGRKELLDEWYAGSERKFWTGSFVLEGGETCRTFPSKKVPLRIVSDAEFDPYDPDDRDKIPHSNYEEMRRLHDTLLPVEPYVPEGVPPPPDNRILLGYFFKKPGVYSIQAIYDSTRANKDRDDWKGRVESEVLHFEVLP